RPNRACTGRGGGVGRSMGDGGCTTGFFFFQAEDGIRDYKVTGVQTCALPISQRERDYGCAAPGRPPQGAQGLLPWTAFASASRCRAPAAKGAGCDALV